MRRYTTAHIMGQQVYTIYVNGEHRVDAVAIDGPGLHRRFYKRTPKQYELGLTPATFRNAVTWICRLDSQMAARIREEIYEDSQYLDIVNDVLKKLYIEYKLLIKD